MVTSSAEPRITISTSCIRSGVCCALAPDVFELLAEGRVQVLNTSGVAYDQLLEVAELCPTEAVHVEDAQAQAAAGDG